VEKKKRYFQHPRQGSLYSLPADATKNRDDVIRLAGQLFSLVYFEGWAPPVITHLSPVGEVPTVGGQPVKIWEATLVLDREKVTPFVSGQGEWPQWFEAMRAAALVNTPLIIVLSEEEHERLSKGGLDNLEHELPYYVVRRLRLLDQYPVDGENKPVLLVAHFGRCR